MIPILKRLPLSPFLFLISFQFLLSGLNPTFYMDDSPETVTACSNWGIAHPPGYPLLSTLGHLFTLLPIGSVPFRVNLLAALLAAACVVLLFRLLRDGIGAPLLPAAFLSMTWIFMGPVTANALSAKGAVYHLTCLLLLLILQTILKGRLAFALFLLGLSFAHHWMTMAAALPALLGFGSREVRSSRMDRHRAYAGLFGFIAGLSFLMILPLRAVLHPAPNYNDPSSWGRFLSHLLLEQFRGIQTLRIPHELVPQIKAWSLASLQGMNLLFPLAILGIFLGWRSQRRLIVGLGLLWAFMAASVNYGFPFSARRFEFNYLTQLFPTFLPAILLAGCCVTRLAPSRAGSWSSGLTGAALLIGILTMGTSQSRYTHVHDFSMNALQAVPRDGALFARGDAVDFSLWYLQWVEKRRPDVVVTTVENLPTPWYRERLRQDHPGLDLPEPSRLPTTNPIPAFLRPWVLQNAPRGLYFTYDQAAEDGLGDLILVPRGLLQQGIPGPGAPILQEEVVSHLWQVHRLRRVGDPSVDRLTREHLLVDYAVARSLTGIRRFQDALGPDDPGGSARRDVEGLRKAFLDFEWAHRVMPKEKGYVYNAGLALLNAGDGAGALPWFEKAILLDPAYAEAYFNASLAARLAGSFQKEGALLEAVLSLRPGFTGAQNRLKELIRQGHYRIR